MPEKCEICGNIIPDEQPLCPKCWVVSQKPKEKILIEMDINAVPSEMTARVMLRLIDNFCRQYDKRVGIVNGKLDFENTFIAENGLIPDCIAKEIIDKIHADEINKRGRGLL